MSEYVTHPDRKMVFACPTCDKSTPLKRSDGNYRCRDPDCRAIFTFPIVRQSKNPADNSPASDLRKTLEDMDPDDFPPDDD